MLAEAVAWLTPTALEESRDSAFCSSSSKLADSVAVNLTTAKLTDAFDKINDLIQGNEWDCAAESVAIIVARICSGLCPFAYGLEEVGHSYVLPRAGDRFPLSQSP